MRSKKIVVLPILYRECEIPWFLADRKYADFRSDYKKGLEALAAVFGIKRLDTINADNWRLFIQDRGVDWQRFRELEFQKLVTTLTDHAKKYGWSSYVGGSKNPWSITLSAFIRPGVEDSVSLKLKKAQYCATEKQDYNPNHLLSRDYTICVGNTIRECEAFACQRMADFCRKYGKPRDAVYFVQRHRTAEEISHIVQDITKKLSWYQGTEIL